MEGGGEVPFRQGIVFWREGWDDGKKISCLLDAHQLTIVNDSIYTFV